MRDWINRRIYIQKKKWFEEYAWREGEIESIKNHHIIYNKILNGGHKRNSLFSHNKWVLFSLPVKFVTDHTRHDVCVMDLIRKCLLGRGYTVNNAVLVLTKVMWKLSRSIKKPETLSNNFHNNQIKETYIFHIIFFLSHLKSFFCGKIDGSPGAYLTQLLSYATLESSHSSGKTSRSTYQPRWFLSV